MFSGFFQRKYRKIEGRGSVAKFETFKDLAWLALETIDNICTVIILNIYACPCITKSNALNRKSPIFILYI